MTTMVETGSSRSFAQRKTDGQTGRETEHTPTLVGAHTHSMQVLAYLQETRTKYYTVFKVDVFLFLSGFVVSKTSIRSKQKVQNSSTFLGICSVHKHNPSRTVNPTSSGPGCKSPLSVFSLLVK